MQIQSMSFATMCATLFLTTTAFSQVKATTYDGKEVVLHEDGTWEYVDKTDVRMPPLVLVGRFVRIALPNIFDEEFRG